MARDRKQEAMLNYVKDRINKFLPYVYSSVAVALYRVLEGTEEEKIRDIITLIEESQSVWNESVNEGKDMAEWCMELTGIDVKGAVG